MMYSPDTACSLLQAAFDLLNSSCHSDIIKEKPEDQLNKNINKLSDKLNRPDNIFIADSTKNGELITNILNTMEKLTLNLFKDNPRNQIVITPELDVATKVSSDFCTAGVEYFDLILNENVMQVPCPISNQDKDGAVFIVYKGKESSFNEKLSWPEDYDDDMAVLNSRVVTGAITGTLRSNVTLQLVQIKELKPSYELTCVFWDPKSNEWSDYGCIKNSSESNNTHIICSCNHLSSFAVLIAPRKPKDDFVLTIISYVGLCLSVFCLLLSLLTFVLCRSLRSAHTSVLTALCSCLFLGQVLFLVGIDQTKYKILCAIIAGGLHFLFLSAFSWMSIESILLLMTVRNLRAVNYMTSHHSNVPLMCLLGFGIPAVIVGISAAIRPDGYGTKTNCWLSYPSPIWSFLGPVAVFIIVST
ncbi:Belongs to the G-protein coupled receptor 2 family, partial [Pristimantis euphronides]